MIGVLTASTTSGSVLGYDLGDLKNKDQKIRILSFEGVFLDARQVDRLNQNWTDESSRKEFKYISRSVANDLAHQFDSQASMNDRIVRTTGHVSLSFSPADLPKLDDESMVKYAEEYMERMGIVDTQYVITRHFETNAPHLHIAYNRVKYDGTVIDSKNERYRSQKVAAEISEKYELAVAGDSPRLEESLSPQQQLFSQMRTLAREALAQSCTMEEFKKNLRDRGICLQVSEHSENQKSYGLSFSMIEHLEVLAKGSKLDRSALSYAKVTATLAQNLDNRVSVESQLAAKKKQTKATELRNAYRQMVPTIQELDRAVRNTFQLYADTKAAGIAISAQTTQKYNELNRSWNEFRQLNQERSQAKASEDIIKAIGGMLMLLNPLAGLLVILLGRIATDIRLSEIQGEKKALLNKIEVLKSDIDALKQQKESIKFEKKERLDDYLQAKDALDEFRQGMNTVKEEIDAIKRGIQIDELKHRFPFGEPGHIQYIVHSRTDASLFHAGYEETKQYRRVPTGEYFENSKRERIALTEDKIESARLMLKDKGYMVAGDRGPDGYDGFYQSLQRQQEYKDYRVGNMYIHTDGKISFGPEKIFGDAQKTAPAFAREISERPQLAQVSERKPVQAEQTPPTYEIVETFTADYQKFRIKKEANGMYKLQQLEPDTSSPVIDHKYSKNAWFVKAKFTSFTKVANDANGVYFKIKDYETGKTRYINQYGSDLSKKKLQRLGLAKGNGKGGRSM